MKKSIFIILLSLSFFKLDAQETMNCYIFIAEECPISIYMVQPLKKAIAAYGDEVKFIAVFPKSNSTEESAKRFLKTYELNGIEIMLDTQQEFARETKATITPEAIVTNTKGAIIYRGRISDAYSAPGKMKHGPRNNDLVNVLGVLSKGDEVLTKRWKPAVGCYITFH